MYSPFYLVIESTFPILTPFKKKGENGLIGVIGGSLEYTGAPYYSGISSLKSGADVVHIFCYRDAAIPIKSYSPELIVHPGFDQDENSILLQKTLRWLRSMNSLVVGPGLGREESMSKIFDSILNVSKDLGIWHVMDADSIFHFIKNKENPVIKEILSNLSYKFIFTPNSGEFQRLYNSFYNDFEALENPEEERFLKSLDLQDEIVELEVEDIPKLFQREIKLSNVLGNKIILKKGFADIMTNGKTLIIVGNKGSNKRCGGIGDILSGMIASIVSLNRNSEIDVLKCVASACYLCREASRNAFKKYYYSLTAPNVIEEISFSMSKLLKENYSKMD